LELHEIHKGVGEMRRGNERKRRRKKGDE